ncbi:MAG: LytR/AlgR family response regulator transcription factor [Bryobacteraceae bacterium]
MIRVLLVDDEQPARDHLRELLAPHADLEVIGEAEEGEQAIEMIAALKPDLVLLDIQMPGCSGLDIAASLPLPRPMIVFCTAFDKYAVDAFEVHAVDYLLKPVNRVRLAKALDRVRQTVAPGRDDAVDNLIRTAPRPQPRFLAKQAGRYRVVAAEEADYFSIDEGMTALHASGQRCWMDVSLAELERRLDPAAFVRISREHVVRIAAIAEVLPLVGGYAEVMLRNGDRLPVSRRRLKPLLDVLGAIC